jgi:hypothetical protein
MDQQSTASLLQWIWLDFPPTKAKCKEAPVTRRALITLTADAQVTRAVLGVL